MNNVSSYCGLVDAKIRASDKYLPVQAAIQLEEKMQLVFSKQKDTVLP